MMTGLEKLKAKQDFAKEADKVSKGPKIEIRRRTSAAEGERESSRRDESVPDLKDVKEGGKVTAGDFQWTAFISIDYKKKLAFLKAVSGHTYKALMEEAIEYLCEKYEV